METVLIFLLIALFGIAVVIVTIFCFIWVLLQCEVE
jgi:hypothetical protein